MRYENKVKNYEDAVQALERYFLGLGIIEKRKELEVEEQALHESCENRPVFFIKVLEPERAAFVIFKDTGEIRSIPS